MPDSRPILPDPDVPGPLETASAEWRFATPARMLEEAARRLAAAGVESPRLEAQLLLAHALGVSRTAVLAGLHPDPDDARRRAFAGLVERREQRIPLAYLRGTQEFYGLTFAVSPAVLIPRPETEMLVDFVLEKLPLPIAASDTGKRGTPVRRPVLADVGAGSGCIAIAALVNRPDARAVAIDISRAALDVARRNAAANRVAERIDFVLGSLLESARAESLEVIVSNPPYIPTEAIPDLQAEVRDWEPRTALDGGVDGLRFQREIAQAAARALKPGGWLAVEGAQGQAERVAELFASAGLTQIETRRDLAGISRIVCGRRT